MSKITSHQPLLQWLHGHLPYLSKELQQYHDSLSFRLRMLRMLLVVTILGVISISIGALGFRLAEEISWLRSFYWATMTITGCGIPQEPSTDAGQLWGICYAFYGAVFFVGVFASFLHPVGHRIIQRYVEIAKRASDGSLMGEEPPEE
jgi:hypothetical protein